MAMKNSNKRQLVFSMMTLGLSVTMLMGTTLAWFTSTQEVGLHEIKAGTLTATLTPYNGSETIEWHNVTQVEPGGKYRTKEFTVSNTGSLAMKGKLTIEGLDTSSASLGNALNLHIYKYNSDGTIDKNKDYKVEEIELLSGESEQFVVYGEMPITLGNEYQGAVLSNVSVLLQATQSSHESDSFGNVDYDSNANSTPVSNSNELVEAIKNGATSVSLAKDIDLKGSTLDVKGDLTIYGNGNKIITSNQTTIIKAHNVENANIVLSDVNLENPTLENTKEERSAINIYNSKNVTVNIDKSEISAIKYGIRVDNKCEGITMNVSNSKIKGWAALQIFSNNVKATFDNCHLIGNNVFGEGKNNFGTIVTAPNANGNTLRFNKCTIEANTDSDNLQVHFLNLGENNSFEYDNCEFSANSTKVDKPTTN